MGFRPAIFRYARSFKLTGFVRNDTDGVTIEVEGDTGEISHFGSGLHAVVPALARIDSITIEDIQPTGEAAFRIIPSVSSSGGVPPIPADIATCPDCLAEMEDSSNRRYGYPFITCTACGPRFTLVRKTPYDRERTSMSAFRMCPECEREYNDPSDRRFHSETNSCGICGPRLELLDGEGRKLDPDEKALEGASQALLEGKIVAIKGIGGFHLACNALDAEAVKRLRNKKGRAEKPFAVMVRDLDEIAKLVKLDECDAELLASPVAPILIADRIAGANLPEEIAPGNHTLGIFVAYSPMHRLLFSSGLKALVMTSGNKSEEPIAISNIEAVERLKGIADFYLVHDREILCRADDSIMKRINGTPVVMRRSRGIVPEGIPVPVAGPDVLALGGELKNTIAILAGKYAYTSPYVGDLENPEAFDHFRESIERLQTFCDCRPSIIACDMHPGYMSTSFAERLVSSGQVEGNAIKLVKVQHHHAHVVSCMAEHGINETVIGVSFDGTGYGPDGTVWGGEFLVADNAGFNRAGMLRQVSMPGGDAAAREPYRMAASYIYEAFGPEPDPHLLESAGISKSDYRVFSAMMKNSVSCPLTSSAGRLFDAVSALLGICRQSTFEGQAAMALETMAMDCGMNVKPEKYRAPVIEKNGKLVVDTVELFRQIAIDVLDGKDRNNIAMMFHSALTEAVVDVCRRIREKHSLEKVILSGGVFQNAIFSKLCQDSLKINGFNVFAHGSVPPNDGGICVGQAVVAREVDGCVSPYRCGL